jgi:NADPH:quinone reductase-like Zn-dependent oxidoreductase
VRAITIPEFGQASVLTFAEIEKPSPGAGEVLVLVAATAVNRADLLQFQGLNSPASSLSWAKASRVGKLGILLARWSRGAATRNSR